MGAAVSAPSTPADGCQPLGLICEPSACLEDGRFDNDCCALPASGTCQSGYTFAFNQHSNGCVLHNNPGYCCTPDDVIENGSDELTASCNLQNGITSTESASGTSGETATETPKETTNEEQGDDNGATIYANSENYNLYGDYSSYIVNELYPYFETMREAGALK